VWKRHASNAPLRRGAQGPPQGRCTHTRWRRQVRRPGIRTEKLTLQRPNLHHGRVSQRAVNHCRLDHLLLFHQWRWRNFRCLISSRILERRKRGSPFWMYCRSTPNRQKITTDSNMLCVYREA